MRNGMWVALVLMVALAAGCATGGKKGAQLSAAPDVSIPTGVHEQLVWSSEPKRPGWTMQEPDTANGVMSFVGLSGTFGTEQSAREDARRNAVNGVVNYMGTLVKDKFERARVSFGLESDVVNPTDSARAFQKQLAVSVANRVKAKQWYEEKWQAPTGVGWRSFVLVQVPEAAVEESYKQMTRDMARNAEQKAKEANDEIAKVQAEKAVEFWSKMQEQGLAE